MAATNIQKTMTYEQKNGLTYLLNEQGKRVRFKPWLGDLFSFAYDRIMANSVFPKKFGANIDDHTTFLAAQLKTVHDNRVLELATGSGSAAEMMPNDNDYTGSDISEGLLKKAVQRFERAGFENAGFYVCGADELPFEDGRFDLCLCNLSLNFFPDLETVIREVRRVLKPDGVFLCSVPVPERNGRGRTIRGTLYTQDELARRFGEHGFVFEPFSFDNGALFYFKATKMSEQRVARKGGHDRHASITGTFNDGKMSLLSSHSHMPAPELSVF